VIGISKTYAMKSKLGKGLFFLVFSMASLFIVFACDADTRGIADNNDTLSNQMKITIGTAVFTATLLDNETARAWKSMLPLTLNMSELNENEKYFHFPDDLPANASNPRTIHAGDLMLWGANSLVIFYETFSTSYSYTPIGSIDDPSGLALALGSGSVTVKFELE
jgi:hypothetical protein